MADVKTNAPTSAPQAKTGGSSWIINLIIVIACLVIAEVFFYVVLGATGNFHDGATKHSPKNWMGQMYSGGVIVPFLIGMFLVMICFAIERALTIVKAKGKMSNAEFIKKIQYHLTQKNVDAALSECDRQSGSVGNVMKAGLKKYKEMMTNTSLDTDQKVEQIKKEVEETTALELPMLEKNLVFLSTITSAATLLGLLGTVTGMIKAFSGMAAAGAPDANALAQGISEALFNTALGIGTSFFAMIFYNLYTTVIDNITYGIDESGFTLEQSFKANYK